MKINEIRVTLDRSLGAKLGQKWETASATIRKGINRAIRVGDWDRADELIEQLDISQAVEGNTKFIKFVSAQAMVLGAAQLADVSVLEIRRRDQSDAVGKAVGFLKNALVAAGARQKARLHDLVQQHRKLSQEQEDEILQKALDLPDIEALLDKETLGSGFAGIDINSSLANSRMSSLGFTLEAQARGIDYYKIQAVLDSRTGELDRRMNGTTFEVRMASQTLERGFTENSPEAWKANMPFYGGSRDSVRAIDRMSMSQMIDVGVHLPPYHPYCRCVIIQSSQAEFVDFVGDTDGAFGVPTRHLNTPMPKDIEQLLWEGRLATADKTKDALLKAFPNMTEDEARALQAYVSSSATTEKLNTTLRGGGKMDSESAQWLKSAMSAALEKMPVAENRLVVRGLAFNKERFDDFVGDFLGEGTFTSTFKDEGFMSTATVLEEAFVGRKYGAKLHIEHKNGRDVSSYAPVDTEREVILSSGSKFRVLGTSLSETKEGQLFEVWLRQI